MLEAAVIGGGLQGIEITYLANQAGYRTLLVDKKAQVPARGLADDFFQADMACPDRRLLSRLSQSDIIFPACENFQALIRLDSLRKNLPPIILDLAAYQLSSSKEKSKEFFRKAGLPCARDWREVERNEGAERAEEDEIEDGAEGAGFPLIVKPVEGSGSEDVRLITSREELNALEAKPGDGTIIAEEYLQGPTYSLEVIAYRDQIYPLKITRLFFDQQYDCRQVVAGGSVPNEVCRELIDIGKRAARDLNLTGIMDLEVIAAESGLKLLEIDARFPSQTPSAVYQAWGINMVKILVELYLELYPENQSREFYSTGTGAACGAAIYEQLLVQDQQVFCTGEHIMTEAGLLRQQNNFFGADTALTDYRPGSREWRAILHYKGDSIKGVKKKRKETLDKINSLVERG